MGKERPAKEEEEVAKGKATKETVTMLGEEMNVVVMIVETDAVAALGTAAEGCPPEILKFGQAMKCFAARSSTKAVPRSHGLEDTLLLRHRCLLVGLRSSQLVRRFPNSW